MGFNKGISSFFSVVISSCVIGVVSFVVLKSSNVVDSVVSKVKDFKSVHRGVASIPSAILASFIIGLASITTFKSINVVDNIVNKVGDIRVAQQVAQSEMERIRTLNYNDVIKLEKVPAEEVTGFVKELVLEKEYREDIANTVMKHKPFALKIFKSGIDIPLVTIKGEKTSRWYKSGSFDNSDMGIYDETGIVHAGSIRKTGYGTGYVFLKKGSQINGNIEIYDETNGDIYIYNSLGSASADTLIRHIGPSTSSGYIKLAPSCTVSGTVTFENSSNGGMIIENSLRNVKISKTGNGTGYLMLSKGSSVGGNVEVYNESGGSIVLKGTLADGCVLRRTGNSEGLLTINGTVRGNVTINMEDSGKVNINGTCYDGTNITYKSGTNKSLTLTASNIRGNVSIFNNSMGTLTVNNKMSDGSILNVSGTGIGSNYMYGVVDGTVNLVNNTSGYMSISVPIKSGKTVTKTGGGSGYLEIASGILEGDFTLDSDGSGRFYFSRGYEYELGQYRQPWLADGVYVKIRGKIIGFSRFWVGVQAFGYMDIDVTNNPLTNLSWGYYQNGYNNYSDYIVQDGYRYRS